MPLSDGESAARRPAGGAPAQARKVGAKSPHFHRDCAPMHNPSTDDRLAVRHDQSQRVYRPGRGAQLYRGLAAPACGGRRLSALAQQALKA